MVYLGHQASCQLPRLLLYHCYRSQVNHPNSPYMENKYCVRWWIVLLTFLNRPCILFLFLPILRKLNSNNIFWTCLLVLVCIIEICVTYSFIALLPFYSLWTYITLHQTLLYLAVLDRYIFQTKKKKKLQCKIESRFIKKSVNSFYITCIYHAITIHCRCVKSFWSRNWASKVHWCFDCSCYVARPYSGTFHLI